jgi:hypothetical protein
MFHRSGDAFTCCDGISRRNLLRVGFLGLGGLTLPGLLRQRASAREAGQSTKSTSVIFIELAGGPTQHETYDPKPRAPIEYRGPLGTVATSLPGVHFSEMMAHQAGIADKLAVIRSIHHNSGSHQTSAHLTQTGYYLSDRQNRDNEMPCIGSVTSRMRGPNAKGLPAFVSIPSVMRYGQAAFLGKGFNPFITGGDPNSKSFRVNNLAMSKNLNLDRLDDRRQLLKDLDEGRRVMDNHGVSDALDDFSSQAFDMITGDRARQAFDLSQESDAMRAQYGRSTVGQSLLLARRLVEAGVTFVTVRVGGWDDHQQLVKRLRQKAPQFDQGVAALITDLEDRGMLRDVMIVAMGEFGRTPKVNKNAGRDHWGSVMSVMLAGGQINLGQVIGASNSKGEVPVDAPYRPEHVLAMAYRHLDIDPAETFLDLSGRPRYVLDQRHLIKELI